MNGVSLTTDALACYRITRLLVEDAILDTPRRALKRRLMRGQHTKLLELVGCPWCVSVYVAAGIVAARRVAPVLWGPLAAGLACSAVTGLIAELEAG